MKKKVKLTESELVNAIRKIMISDGVVYEPIPNESVGQVLEYFKKRNITGGTFQVDVSKKTINFLDTKGQVVSNPLQIK